MRQLTLKTALALSLGMTALGGWSAVYAQDTPAAPPGPAQQPPPAPGTEQPSPTQPPAAPNPPGTETGTSPAAEAAATPAPNYSIQYNGLVDGYYLFNFRNPKDVSAGAGHAYYDVRHNSPALSLAELNVFQNAKPQGLGFKATLIAGDTADLNHGGLGVGTTGEARFKNVQQLYGTYSFGADGAGIDIGKFYTPFGYEVTESNADYNYSRSDAYALLPVYHAGARIYTPVPGVAGLNATLYVVQSVFNTATTGVQNDAKRPGYMGQLNYADPKGKFSLISELGLGSQKFTSADPATTKVILNDNNFTYNLNANQLVGLDYEYIKTTPQGSPKTTTNGYAVYYRQALTPKTAFALRFSGFNAKTDGIPAMGAVPATSSTTVRPYEVTGTYEMKTAANFLTRLEYRHDSSNTASFISNGVDSTGNPKLSKNEDTLSISGVFTFSQ